MFNLRIKEFYDTQQIQIYSRAQRSKGEIERRTFDFETGEIFPLERGELMFNPFTEKFERMTEYKPCDPEEIVRRSCSRTIKAIYDVARSDSWDWFLTFTFNPLVIDRYNYVACSKKMSVWLGNMRRVQDDLKYLVVPERHKNGAWHFHGLFKNCEKFDFVFSGKRDKKGRRVYNVGKYRYGWTTATRITDHRRASSYLCKYITKDMCKFTKGKKRYWQSYNLNKPLVHEYCIESSSDYIFMELIKCCDTDAHLKQLKTSYTNVTYIDTSKQSENAQSIPQTLIFRIDWYVVMSVRLFPRVSL